MFAKRDVRFSRLVEVLEKAGFVIGRHPGPVVLFKNAFVEGGFASADASQGTHPALIGQVCADHVECFDKWRKCPIALSLPADDAELNALLGMLAHLGTEEGRELSNTYGYLDDNPYNYGNPRWSVCT